MDMRLLHTADLHLGQILYQNYDRVDEHDCFFRQLEEWCLEYHPDTLLLCGDIFDIANPSVNCRKHFNDFFSSLHRKVPRMRIIIVAGNHDSASRIHADRPIWNLSGVTMIGMAPPALAEKRHQGWEEDYIVRLDTGYVVAIPYMVHDPEEVYRHLGEYIENENRSGKPVVFVGHTSIEGLDIEGHDIEIGTLRTHKLDAFGKGFDYFALGHIHKPQTLRHNTLYSEKEERYPSGTARYSGSPLHVSCDEKYPHSVSLVDIESRGGDITLRQLRIKELRHFYDLPLKKECFATLEETLSAIKEFAEEGNRGYIRLKIDYNLQLPSNFNQMVYDLIDPYNNEIRYNPKIIWVGSPEDKAGVEEEATFEIAELQQMTDPMEFISQTADMYEELTLEELRGVFDEIKDRMER